VVGAFVPPQRPLLERELHGLYDGMKREIKAHCERR
jgi:hypothetical protein